MTNWNYADVWETVADIQPDAAGGDPGRPHTELGGVRPRGRRRGPVPARPRRGQAGQGGHVPLQLPRVPPEHLRRHEGGPGPGQHQLPLRRRRAELPVGQRRRGGRGLPRRRSPSGSRASSTGCHGSRAGSGSTTAPGPCPDWATPYDDAAKSAIGRVQRAVGPQRRRPLHALHRRHDRHAQGRHVAPGRPLRPPHRQRACATTPSTAGSKPCAPRLEASPGGVTLLPACPLMHGTGDFPSNTVLAEGGRVCLLESPPLRPGRTARHDRAREGQRPRLRGRSVRPPAARRARRASGQVGPELAPHDHLVGGDVERAGEGGVCWPTTRACCWSTPSARRRRSAWACRSPPAAPRPRRRRSRSDPT